MHFDLAHAVVTALIILATLWGLRALGLQREGKWDWRFFGIVFVVIFVMNLIWPSA